MRAIWNQPEGILDWLGLCYARTITAIKSWTYPVRTGAKVKDFAQVIYQLGRERYRFSKDGNGGCRFWVLTLLKDFVTACLIAPWAHTEMLQWMEFQYYEEKEKMPKPLPIFPGTFY
ncbi:hypothetical protein AJ79_03492 [Helicocarpus griseus UAMH5409]|uniref:DUF7770 domain-containing protein n=1 Tax=Helicocarpus griseus UAMH5409 TaxID=1447875 RepID=A0A2B7XPE1_9EURO|nr:hypothetical protein AJ79_03492 [Helicocarpus griseus UAMH5409]